MYLLGQTYPNDVTALLMLSSQSRVINMIKGPNGVPLVLYDGTIPAITHEEGRSMDD